ncbi:hypothetical protein LZK73_21950 [Neorhizobium galegae]|nr:hypothetical protein LZK73_21950 [Neorhizobium galegae]
MTQTITLFIRPTAAARASEDYLRPLQNLRPVLTYEVRSAYLKDHDGRMEQGYRARIVTATGGHVTYL